MSGHSKWSTIKRAKGVADVKRSNTFTKLANAITIATRLGSSGDIDSNPRLRLAVEQARSANMPKDNVQRAIDRGLGKLPGQQLEEVLFEGFGPLKVAFLIEGVTDNKIRTLHEIKNLFDRAGGALGGLGSTAYMFDKKGEIKVVSRGGSSEDEQLDLIDLGAEEVEEFEEDGIRKYLVYTDAGQLNTIGQTIGSAGLKIESNEVVYKPNVTVEVETSEDANRVLDFAARIEDNDDIQKVYANFEMGDAS